MEDGRDSTGSYELEVTDRSARLIRHPFYRSTGGLIGLGVAVVAVGLCGWLALISFQQGPTVRTWVFVGISLLGVSTLVFGVFVTAETFADAESRTIHQQWKMLGRTVFQRALSIPEEGVIYVWAKGANLYEATIKVGELERPLIVYGELGWVRKTADAFARVLGVGRPDDRTAT